MATKAIRILAFDISLSQPGAAVVEISNGKAKIIAKTNVKTNTKESYAERARNIYAWAHMFMRDNRTKKKPYDVIVREKYSSKFNNHSIFSAHSAVDRALFDLNLADTADPIPQQTVKKHVFGKGKAEKNELEQAVRDMTDFIGDFGSDDESDAVAIALCYAIQNGHIKGVK